MSIDIEELLELEHRGWRSLCEGRGDEFYGATTTPEAVMVQADGTVLDHQAVVASLGRARPWSEYEISDERLVPLGEDHAALLYTGRAHREGEPTLTALMCSVWTRAGGPWRLALHQQTVPTGDAAGSGPEGTDSDVQVRD